MTAVNEGDRVRLTCGESVIVGVCQEKGLSYPPSVWVTPDGTDVTFIYDTRWTVEVLAPSIPNFAGTIVRDVTNGAWQLSPSGWQRAGNSQRFTLAELLEHGPVTFVWTPEVGTSHAYIEKDDTGPFPACDICNKQPWIHG